MKFSVVFVCPQYLFPSTLICGEECTWQSLKLAEHAPCATRGTEDHAYNATSNTACSLLLTKHDPFISKHPGKGYHAQGRNKQIDTYGH